MKIRSIEVIAQGGECVEVTQSNAKWMRRFKQYLAVAAGGMIGALLREILEVLVPATQGFPVATLLINWSGSFALAWFYTITIWRFKVPQWLRAGIGTGVIGAYTTFSTFAVETNSMLAKGQIGMAILYVCLSVIGGFILAMWASRLAGEKEESVQDGRTKREGVIDSYRLKDGESFVD